MRDEIRRPGITILLLLYALLLYELRQMVWQDIFLGTVLVEIPYLVCMWVLPLWCGAAFVSIYDFVCDIRCGVTKISAVPVLLYLSMTVLYLFWLLRVNEAVILILTVSSALFLLIRRAAVR